MFKPRTPLPPHLISPSIMPALLGMAITKNVGGKYADSVTLKYVHIFTLRSGGHSQLRTYRRIMLLLCEFAVIFFAAL